MSEGTNSSDALCVPGNRWAPPPFGPCKPRRCRSQVTCVERKPGLPYEFEDGRVNPTVREKYINGNELAIWIQGRTTHAVYRKFEGLWVTRSDIEKLFVVPIDQASKMLGVAKSTMKKLCRRFGINVWRHGSQSCKLTPWRNPAERRDYMAVRRSEASDLKYLGKRSSLYRVACDVSRRASARLQGRANTRGARKKQQDKACVAVSHGGAEELYSLDADVAHSPVEQPVEEDVPCGSSRDCDTAGIVHMYEHEEPDLDNAQCNSEDIDNLWSDLCGETPCAEEQCLDMTEHGTHTENEAFDNTLQDTPLSLTALQHGTKVQLEHATISISKWRRSVQRMQYMRTLMVFGSGRVDVIP